MQNSLQGLPGRNVSEYKRTQFFAYQLAVGVKNGISKSRPNLLLYNEIRFRQSPSFNIGAKSRYGQPLTKALEEGLADGTLAGRDTACDSDRSHVVLCQAPARALTVAK